MLFALTIPGQIEGWYLAQAQAKIFYSMSLAVCNLAGSDNC